MINLMPDLAKKEIRAARSNVILTRYIIVVIFSSLFLALITWGAFILLAQVEGTAKQLIEANDTESAVYSDTKAQVNSLSASLNEAKTILDQEITYSDVLINIAQQMPANTIIDKITLDQTSFNGTPLTLKVYAKTNTDAITLRDRFQSSPFFSSVNFESVSDATTTISGYPVSATMTLTLNRSITE